VLAPQVDADPLTDEPPEGAEGAAAVLEVEVAGPTPHIKGDVALQAQFVTSDH